MQYILDENDQPLQVGPGRAREAAEFWQANRQVADLVTPHGRVSTVFLGSNHSFTGGPPVLWETMFFPEGGGGEDCWRYTSKAEALIGHEKAVRLCLVFRLARDKGTDL